MVVCLWLGGKNYGIQVQVLDKEMFGVIVQLLLLVFDVVQQVDVDKCYDECQDEEVGDQQCYDDEQVV